jgi:hypothetical protein
MLQLIVFVHSLALSVEDRTRRRLTGDRGQSTAEYALVLLGAAGVALLLAAWATNTDRVTRLFNAVLDRILGQAR